MRKYLYLIAIALGLTCCKVDNFQLYDSPNYISFTTKTQDTVEVSFFMLGNLQEYDYPVEVRHTGIPGNDTKEFTVTVNNELSSIKSGMYELPATLTFQPMSKLDTFYIKLTNYAELQSTSAFLCLDLKANSIFELGDRDYRRLVLKINDNVAKPDWWTTTVQNYYLGTYSDKKFRLLMEVVKPDLSNTSDAWIRTWALQLKAYLDVNPTQEDDGTSMTVTVRV